MPDLAMRRVSERLNFSAKFVMIVNLCFVRCFNTERHCTFRKVSLQSLYPSVEMKDILLLSATRFSEYLFFVGLYCLRQCSCNLRHYRRDKAHCFISLLLQSKKCDLTGINGAHKYSIPPSDYNLLIPLKYPLHLYTQKQTIQSLNRAQTTPKPHFQLISATMTPKARNSPPPLIVYPHLHRNSQCHSCSTVMPGDICFNCGRLSALLVTPRPPRNPVEKCKQATAGSFSAQTMQFHQIKPFDFRWNKTDGSMAAKNTYTQPCLQRRAFDSQFTNIENLLDARKKLAHIHTLAANDAAPLHDTASSSSFGRFTCSSRTYSNSSKAHSTYFPSSSSKTLRSDSIAVSDGLSEDGRPHRKDMARWLEGMKPSEKSSAILTRRGVDCRLNLAGRSYEWVLFL